MGMNSCVTPVEVDEFYRKMVAMFVDDDWSEYGSCRDINDRDMFIEEERASEAAQACAGCSVQLECIDDAMWYEDGGHRGLSEALRAKVRMYRTRHIKAFDFDLGRAFNES